MDDNETTEEEYPTIFETMRENARKIERSDIVGSLERHLYQIDIQELTYQVEAHRNVHLDRIADALERINETLTMTFQSLKSGL